MQNCPLPKEFSYFHFISITNQFAICLFLWEILSTSIMQIKFHFGHTFVCLPGNRSRELLNHFLPQEFLICLWFEAYLKIPLKKKKKNSILKSEETSKNIENFGGTVHIHTEITTSWKAFQSVGSSCTSCT